MTCRGETIGSAPLRYCPDPAPPAAARQRAVLRARFIDELTGRGLGAGLTVVAEPAGLLPRVAGSGIAGLIGEPLRRLPGLAAAAVEVAMQVHAQGYLSRRVAATLGPFNTVLGFPADWPDHFEAADLGDVPMHRAGVSLRGRVVRGDLVPPQPVAGATVAITELWHRFPAAHEDPLTLLEPGALLSLRPGLYRDRPAGAASVTALQLAAAAGEAKRLLAAVAAGATVVRLSDRVNLTAGDLLGIDVAHPDLAEIIPIAAVSSVTTPDQSALVTLAHPLALAHAAGTEAVRQQRLPLAAVPNAIRRAAIPADPVVFTAGLLGIGLQPGPVEIAGGAHGLEVQSGRRLQAQTDADGYYRLPPLSRVSQLRLAATGGGLPGPVTRLLSPSYGAPENRFDLVFT
jgi:hypothetical protein